ncbi:MAG: HlyD family secretion protein [Rhodobacterales bacterium]|nr:HlyD family secretion protein [Rhodobacterales bacterium]
MKKLKVFFLIIALLAIGAGLWWWWQHEKVYPSTDDAYLQANVLTIAPQVGGRVAQVAIAENDHVKAGDLLLQIDPDELQAALTTAQAQYDIARQNAGASDSDVSAADARIVGARAALTEAEISYDRNARLRELGDVAQAALDQAKAKRDSAQAAVKAAEAALVAAQNKAGTSGDENASVRAALGALTQAQINLDNSRIIAPADGWIANIRLRPGQVVAANAPLFSLVEDGDWWVDANFKETDLDRIRPGQPVSLSVDMYPGTVMTGTVESIGAGSGAIFSLLPPQNATGNWVKVTQRFPVRIKLTNKPDHPAMQLRVGASVTATVDTSAQDTAR